MLPEITRDEVFRIETQRLWLRWPVAADADALAIIMAQTCAAEGAERAEVDAKALEGLIAAWRDDMTAGHGLHFTVQLKAGARQPIGVIHAGGDRSCIAPAYRTFGDEAADGLRRMTMLLGLPSPIRRSPPMAQQRVFPPPAVLASCCLQA